MEHMPEPTTHTVESGDSKPFRLAVDVNGSTLSLVHLLTSAGGLESFLEGCHSGVTRPAVISCTYIMNGLLFSLPDRAPLKRGGQMWPCGLNTVYLAA